VLNWQKGSKDTYRRCKKVPYSIKRKENEKNKKKKKKKKIFPTGFRALVCVLCTNNLVSAF